MREKILKILENGDDYIQMGISVVLLASSAIILIYSSYHFIDEMKVNMINAVFHLLQKLFLIMIILELMNTVLTYLKEHTIPLEPFIVIGIISALRKLLMAGAHISIMEGESINELLFKQYLYEIGFNTFVVLILVIALYLVKRYKGYRKLT